MQQRSDLYTLPEGLPVPTDDGACDHLRGLNLPSIALHSTDGHLIDLASLPGRTVVYVYPRTGRPDHPGRLPTFEFEPYGSESSTHLTRMALVIRDGRIEKVFYPVFPPDRNAEDVIAWLKENPR